MPQKKFRPAPWTASEKEKAGQAIDNTICQIEREMKELQEMIEQTKEFVAARLESKNQMGTCVRVLNSANVFMLLTSCVVAANNRCGPLHEIRHQV